MSNYRQDEELLQGLRGGNRELWQSFYREHEQPFVAFVIKYGGLDNVEADALYQEAIVLLHRNIREGRLLAPLRSTLRTYLFGIAKNLCRKHGRGNISFPGTLPDIPENQMEVQQAQQHHAALVAHLLKSLGGMCEKFLRLVFIEERDQDEVSRLMQIPSAEAFRKRKHDCLKRIRKLMGD